jgi:hypothetical protein
MDRFYWFITQFSDLLIIFFSKTECYSTFRFVKNCEYWLTFNVFSIHPATACALDWKVHAFSPLWQGQSHFLLLTIKIGWGLSQKAQQIKPSVWILSHITNFTVAFNMYFLFVQLGLRMQGISFQISKLFRLRICLKMCVISIVWHFCLIYWTSSTVHVCKLSIDRRFIMTIYV